EHSRHRVAANSHADEDLAERPVVTLLLLEGATHLIAVGRTCVHEEIADTSGQGRRVRLGRLGLAARHSHVTPPSLSRPTMWRVELPGAATPTTRGGNGGGSDASLCMLARQ